MKLFLKVFAYLLIFQEYHHFYSFISFLTKRKYNSIFFVNASLKNIATCVIVDNKCLFNQLAYPNSYCFEENTFRIYKTNIQTNKLKKRDNVKNTVVTDDNKTKETEETTDKKIYNSFNFYKKKYYDELKKKKIENKFLMKYNKKLNKTESISQKLVNDTNSSLYSSLEKNKELEIDEKNETDEKKEVNEFINYDDVSTKVSLVQRALHLEDYSYELCKIDYETFVDHGVYLFDNSNRLVMSKSVPVKSMYICDENNSVNCHLPYVDGYYLNVLQKEAIIELTGIQQSNTVLTSIKPEDGYSFINSELLPKTLNKFNKDLIVCNYDLNSSKVLCDIRDGSEGAYYIQKTNNKNYLIECTEGNCSLNSNNIKDGFYLNSGSSSMNNTLIYCKNNSCSFQKANNEEYYIGIQQNENIMIECQNDSCWYNKYIAEGYYINAGTLIEDNEKPIIYCDPYHNCESKKVTYNRNGHFISSSNIGYLITCRNDTYCEHEKSPANNGYYISNSQDEITSEINLIYCHDQNNTFTGRICEEKKFEDAEKDGHFVSGKPGYLINYALLDENSYVLLHPHPEAGYYLNNGDTFNNTLPLIYCEGAANTTLAISCTPTKSNDGYYLLQSSRYNSDSDYYTKLIFCENSSCISYTPIKGYYKYALDVEYIISCDGFQCHLEAPEDCQATYLPRSYSPGNCCYYQSNMYLITEALNITTTITGLEFKNYSFPFQNDDTLKYAYFEVEFSEFPGMTINYGSLYKISKHSFTYFPYDNYFILTKNNEQLLTLDTTISEYDINNFDIFNCDSSKEICIPEEECEYTKLIYYEPLNLGVQCSNSTLKILNTEGNYLNDDNSVLRCDNTGKSKLLKPSTITNSTLNGSDIDIKSCYIINSGNNNSTYPLIKCSSESCELFEPTEGFYYDCEAKRIIKFKNIQEYYYVNNTNIEFPVQFLNYGSDSSSEQLISCMANNCTIIPPKEGYYLSDKTDKLIYCEESSSCKEIESEEGYYPDSNSLVNGVNYILRCAYNATNNLNCLKEEAKNGFYISTQSNTIINCLNDDKICKTISKRSGIYMSASLTKLDDDSDDDDDDNYKKLSVRNLSTELNEEVHNLISCTTYECIELTKDELMKVPICEFSNNKCFISLRYSSFRMETNLITKGGYCTNYYHTILYFATDSIETEPVEPDLNYNELFNKIDENCLIASNQYKSYYYTIDSTIYNIEDNQISIKADEGYYFIDVEKQLLLNSNNIKDYNDYDVKLFNCNGEYCSIKNNFSLLTYFVDFNKRLFQYDPSHHKYFFPYDEDISCSYNKKLCQPSRDVNGEEFCVGTDGHIIFLQDYISRNSTVHCTMVKSDSSSVLVYYQDLYRLSSYSAELTEEKGYYLINNNTRTSVELTDFKTNSEHIILYGCNGEYCKEYSPGEGIYYYDYLKKYLVKFENNIWSVASSGGYAVISLYPGLTHVFEFGIRDKIATISSKSLSYGSFYTIDEKMIECNVENNECLEKDTTGYTLTTTGEMYYCEYNSQHGPIKIKTNSTSYSTEKGYRNILSSCIKKKCIVGNYYYINNNYYLCKKDSILVLMKLEQCIDDLDVEDIQENHENIASAEGFGKYIIHFPTQDEYPDNIKYINYLIEYNNNSTAMDTTLSPEYIPSISGVFRNCRYDLESSKMVFDLICLNNYVSLAKDLAKKNEQLLERKDNGIEKGAMKPHDLSGVVSFLKKRKNKDNDEKNTKKGKVLEEFNISYSKGSQPFICSTKNYGYIECQKDKNNPEKCSPSQATVNYIVSKNVLFSILIFYIIKFIFN